MGPDTCLVISHAHRIAINEQEKGSGAGRRCAGAGTKVAKGSFVEVWEVGSGFCWTTARASRERSCSATRLCDADNPHFSVKHLYVGASRATSAELVSVC